MSRLRERVTRRIVRRRLAPLAKTNDDLREVLNDNDKLDALVAELSDEVELEEMADDGRPRPFLDFLSRIFEKIAEDPEAFFEKIARIIKIFAAIA